MNFVDLSEVLGNLGNFLGSLAVLATLGYLAAQVRHANRAAALAAMQANRAERRAWFLSIRDSPTIVPIFLKNQAGEPLTPEETVRYTNHLNCWFALLYSEWLNRDIGLARDYAVSDSAYLNEIATLPAYRHWWLANARRVYPGRFCDYVDRAIAEHDATGIEKSSR